MFEQVGFGHTWGMHRVFFRRPGGDRVYSIPATWTSVVEDDPFVVAARGRSLFRVRDLVDLVALVDEVGGGP